MFYISVLLPAINHKQCSQRKWNCWQNNLNKPRYWSVSAAAPWLLALLWVACTYTWKWMWVCVCPTDGNLIYSQMGGEGWVAVRQWDVKLQLSSPLQGLQYHCAQQAYPPCTYTLYTTPGAPPLPSPRLLNLLVWLSLPQITCWDSGQGCAWFIKEGGRRGCCG